MISKSFIFVIKKLL